MSSRILPAAICLALMTGPWQGLAASTEQASVADSEKIIQRILELQRQIEELLEQLPAEAREELRRQLAETLRPGAGEESVTPPPREPDVAAVEATSQPAAADGTPRALEPVVGDATQPPSSPEPVSQEATTRPAESELTAAETAAAAVQPGRFVRDPDACNTLWLFDNNEDGIVSAVDRYWRYLLMWTDHNGDSTIQENEVESLYDGGVRDVDVDLKRFIRAKGGTAGDIDVDDYVMLDIFGDGFGNEFIRRLDDAVLMVDATRLKRGTGPEILDASGEPVEGTVPFQKGWQIREHSGEITDLNCP